MEEKIKDILGEVIHFCVAFIFFFILIFILTAIFAPLVTSYTPYPLEDMTTGKLLWISLILTIFYFFMKNYSSEGI